MSFLHNLISKFFKKNKVNYNYLPIEKPNTNIDVGDDRDLIYMEKNIKLDKSHIIPNLPPIRKQGILSSCASHAAIGCYEIQLKPNQYIEGSELFHYYNVRVQQKGTLDNVGMTLREACIELYNNGFALEILWPYDIKKYNETPSHIAYMFTSLYSIKNYQRLLSLTAIKENIMLNIPIMCGIRVQNNFNILDKKNYIYDPKTKTGTGHAVIIVGYNEITKRFILRNCWGNDCGNDGYFEMPYESFSKTSFDWWIINLN